MVAPQKKKKLSKISNSEQLHFYDFKNQTKYWKVLCDAFEYSGAFLALTNFNYYCCVDPVK